MNSFAKDNRCPTPTVHSVSPTRATVGLTVTYALAQCLCMRPRLRVRPTGPLKQMHCIDEYSKSVQNGSRVSAMMPLIRYRKSNAD